MGRSLEKGLNVSSEELSVREVVSLQFFSRIAINFKNVGYSTNICAKCVSNWTSIYRFLNFPKKTYKETSQMWTDGQLS